MIGFMRVERRLYSLMVCSLDLLLFSVTVFLWEVAFDSNFIHYICCGDILLFDVLYTDRAGGCFRCSKVLSVCAFIVYPVCCFFTLIALVDNFAFLRWLKVCAFSS